MVGTFVGVYHTFLEAGILPPYFPKCVRACPHRYLSMCSCPDALPRPKHAPRACAMGHHAAVSARMPPSLTPSVCTTRAPCVHPRVACRFTLATPEPQGLTSFALSLLLVFRTNSSYGRFDEARKIWGGILNRARNLGNQVRARTRATPALPESCHAMPCQPRCARERCMRASLVSVALLFGS